MNRGYSIIMIHYLRPDAWIKYDGSQIINELATAKAAVLSLQTVPFQRRWVERLQKMELKREVAGTSRIEGAEFSTRELDRVMKEETPDELYTRSQRQAAAALKTYAYIRGLPLGEPINATLIRSIHRLIVTDADDDHCTPGALRTHDQNVTFGSPGHRGVDGGDECIDAFASFTAALETEFRAHDPLVQAIAAHYHIAAMHPFLDGNGRTARAVEAFMLRRAELRDTTFIAMSNYYYDEKITYLASLAAVREARNDLTPFLKFALRGVELQARRLLAEIQREIKRELFRNLMHDLFGRLKTPRKRVIAERQVRLLSALLSVDGVMSLPELLNHTAVQYNDMKSGVKAFLRDLSGLSELGAVELSRDAGGNWQFNANLDWPQNITETAFFEAVKKMPKASTNWLAK
jgi:Fic family protein